MGCALAVLSGSPPQLRHDEADGLTSTSEASPSERCLLAILVVVLQGVYVPHLYTDITTQRVLVMEWVEGTRLRSGGAATVGTGNQDDLKLVEIGVRCSLEQMLEEVSSATFVYGVMSEQSALSHDSDAEEGLLQVCAQCALKGLHMMNLCHSLAYTNSSQAVFCTIVVVCASV